MTDFLVRFLTGTLHGIVERIRFGQVIDASEDFCTYLFQKNPCCCDSREVSYTTVCGNLGWPNRCCLQL
jgi:hypothetical protein